MKAVDYIKKGWTQGAFARKADGSPTYSLDPEAVCWCAFGALNMAYPDHGYVGVFTELKTAIGGEQLVAYWNDDPNRTQQEVIAMFEKLGL